jgi:hypothetical protein
MNQWEPWHLITPFHDEVDGLTLSEWHSEGYDCTDCHATFQSVVVEFLLQSQWLCHGTMELADPVGVCHYLTYWIVDFLQAFQHCNGVLLLIYLAGSLYSVWVHTHIVSWSGFNIWCLPLRASEQLI